MTPIHAPRTHAVVMQIYADPDARYAALLSHAELLEQELALPGAVRAQLHATLPEDMRPVGDGGPAFPSPDVVERGFVRVGREGASLRDYFAAHETLSDWYDKQGDYVPKSVLEHLAGEPAPSVTITDLLVWERWNAKWRANLRYLRADAMLAARSKGGPK